MKDGPDIASLAALIGDPARANMMAALMSGMALTAGELAHEAQVTPQTASAHLARLRDAGLIVMEIQGRHRYFRLAGPDVAAALEGLMELAARMGRMRSRPGPRDEALRFARVCYDHLAGTLGVRLHDMLVAQGLVVATADGLGLSSKGRARFIAEGIEADSLSRPGKAPCRACLDWSERRHHLAGPLSAALLQSFIRRGWVERDSKSRALLFSRSGLDAFEHYLAPAETRAAG